MAEKHQSIPNPSDIASFSSSLSLGVSPQLTLSPLAPPLHFRPPPPPPTLIYH